MLTWSDHYANDQLKAVNKATGLQGRPTLFSDNSDAYLKIKQTGSQFDIVSGDALWVPKYHKDGLTESFDLSSLPVSKQLYSLAREFPFWKDGSNYMGYPFSWSTVQIYYNPKYVKVKPDSWHALLDKKYKGKISLENIPTDMMAIAGRATGREEAVRDDDGRDLAGEGVPEVVQAERPQARLAEQRGRAGARRRLGVDRDHEPRHRRPRQGCGRPDGDARVPEGGNGRLHRLRADRQGLEEQGLVREVREHDAAGAVDREELPHERPAAVQREGLQDPRQPGARRPRPAAALQQAARTRSR